MSRLTSCFYSSSMLLFKLCRSKRVNVNKYNNNNNSNTQK